jgi:MFS family permease
MNSQQLSAPVRSAVATLYAAAALSVFAALAVIADQAWGDGLAQKLRDTYPHRSPGDLSMAESSILTYLFILAAAGAVFFVWMARASRRGRRWVRGAGAVTVALGSVLSLYHFTQPHPLVMTLAGLLPCLAGLAGLALLRRPEATAHFNS